MDNLILNVISERAYELHKEHLNKLCLKYSILEKSEGALRGKSISDIYRMRMDEGLQSEAITLISDIEAHRLYFSSFAGGICKCERLKKYVSENSFLYNAYLECRRVKYGFCFIMANGKDVQYFVTNNACEAFINNRYKPVLALDLYEHSYFLDYGFEREAYVKKAMSYLNLTLLNECT